LRLHPWLPPMGCVFTLYFCGNSGRSSGHLYPRWSACARSIQNLTHLHMRPSSSASSRDLSGIELTSNCVAACVPGTLDFADKRQDVGRKLRGPRSTSRTHVLHGASRVRAPRGASPPCGAAAARSRRAPIRSAVSWAIGRFHSLSHPARQSTFAPSRRPS
jgi:hypothetical protein